MKDNEIRIVELEAMRVASFHAFGSQPEDQAWTKLEAWAKPRGLLDLSRQRVFGFNNPSPSAASPNYGYEFILSLPEGCDGDDGAASGEAETKTFPGGLYAVTSTGPINDPNVDIPQAWQRLAIWLDDSPYQMGAHQWLEEHPAAGSAHPGDWMLDLYIPIAKR